MTIVLGGREAGWCTNHDSRSPFFSLLSLNYSKAIISSSFHHQSPSANSRAPTNAQPSSTARRAHRMRGQPTAPQSPCSGPTDVARGAWPPKSREDCRGGLRSSKVPRWYLDTPKITSRYPSNAMFWDHPRCSRQPRSRRRTLPILPPSPLPATAHLQPLAQPIALRHPGSRCDIDSHPDCRSFLTLIVAPQAGVRRNMPLGNGGPVYSTGPYSAGGRLILRISGTGISDDYLTFLVSHELGHVIYAGSGEWPSHSSTLTINQSIMSHIGPIGKVSECLTPCFADRKAIAIAYEETFPPWTRVESVLGVRWP